MSDFVHITETLVVAVFSAGAAYAAIRSDLRNLHARMKSLEEDAYRAHKRIDSLFDQR